jgi:hypothetical protein
VDSDLETWQANDAVPSTDPALWILVIQNFPNVSAKMWWSTIMLAPVIYAISKKYNFK